MIPEIYKLYKANFPQEVFIRRVLAENIQDFVEKYMMNHAIKNAHILDIGCGKQPFRPIFEQLGFQYAGLDYKQNAANNVDIIAPIDSDFMAKYPDLKAYDFVICTEVLEHVAQWHIAFENIYTLTKTGGKVLITCPHFYQLHEQPYDFWRPTPYVLEFYAKKVGFKVIDNIQAGDSWDVLGTFLGNVSSIYYKKNLTLKYKLIFRLLNMVRKWLFRNIENKTLPSNIGVHSPLYLSNIFILEK